MKNDDDGDDSEEDTYRNNTEISMGNLENTIDYQNSEDYDYGTNEDAGNQNETLLNFESKNFFMGSNW